jgi:hypothetical protein
MAPGAAPMMADRVEALINARQSVSERDGKAWSFRRALGLEGPRPSRAGAKRKPEPAGLHALVKLQRADGSWELTKDFAAVIGHPLAELESIARVLSSDPDGSRAWATALALAWLRKEASEDAAIWQMLGAKAAKWLDGVAARPTSGKEWMEEASSYLQP